MTIMVFLHGTLIMHRNAVGKTREEIIKQVTDQEESVRDFASYVPVEKAVEKLNKWVSDGAKICYLSALTEEENSLKVDESILKKFSFPKGDIYHRKAGEEYRDVIERIKPLPDILIEDDCESIGGESEMTYPNLKPELKKKIRSVVVKEFTGIDELSDNPEELGET